MITAIYLNDMNVKTKVGAKLNELREKRGQSQAEFAELLELSAPAYARLERGETYIDLANLARIANILNVPIQEFLPDTLTLNNNNHNGQGGQGGIFFGDFIYNYNVPTDEQVQVAQIEIERLRAENAHLSELVAHLKSQLHTYERLLFARENEGGA